jgi:hypothetical protein
VEKLYCLGDPFTMTKKILLILLNLFIIACIALVAIAPIIPAVIAANVVNATGCQLDEGSIHPCLINGVDYGETLYTMGMMPWFVFFSVPLAVGLFIVYVIIVVIIFLIRVFKKPREEAHEPA